jgi:hypothetical protein
MPPDRKEASDRIDDMTCLLLWEGRLNRSRVCELFRIRDTGASQSIRQFKERHPYALEWNTVTRSYHATPYFYRKHAPEGGDRVRSLHRYLSLTGEIGPTGATPETAFVHSGFPALGTPNPAIFATLMEAIRTGSALRIEYCSMSHPEPHQRTIAPHSMVRAGRRWHVRAYSLDRKDFRDFTLGRILDARRSSETGPPGKGDDAAWNTLIPVRLRAHPDLSYSQQCVIRAEFFANTSGRVDTCRGPLVPYYIQDMRAAIDPDREKPPEYQLIVHNLEVVSPWLWVKSATTDTP